MVRVRESFPALFASLLMVQLMIVGHGIVADAQNVPPWETAAGGKMAFDVASIRPSAPGSFTPPAFPLSNDDAYKDTHGLFFADFPLSVYIEFAYKIRPSPEESEAMLGGLPKWVSEESFTIHARAAGEPTKDQMRLMMQALLADRFKLAVHYETKIMPVLILTLDKPGRAGPKLRPHSEGPACDAPVAPRTNGSSMDIPAIFPAECDAQGMFGVSGGKVLVGSRNTTMQVLAEMLSPLGQLGRPVVDETGLKGRFDYTLLFTPEPESSNPPNAGTPVNSEGTSFLEAMKEQLGLKLTKSKRPVQVLVVDHVELPSAN